MSGISRNTMDGIQQKNRVSFLVRLNAQWSIYSTKERRSLVAGTILMGFKLQKSQIKRTLLVAHFVVKLKRNL